MRKFLKALWSAAAGLFAAAALTTAVFAEDYVFEITDPEQTNGTWGQAFVHYTCNDLNHPGNFDATWITPESEVIVEYSAEGDNDNTPLELIWQTWDGPIEPDPMINGTWNKVAPYELDGSTAKFSYDDIVEAYGTKDFSTVYAINVGDRGVKLTVTGVTITNCNIIKPEEETEPETEAADEAAETEKPTETEKSETTVKETTAPETEATTTEATTNIADNAPKEGGGGTVAVIIIVIAAAAAGIGAAVFFMLKKNKGKYY